jgi:hypothetical protein
VGRLHRRTIRPARKEEDGRLVEDNTKRHSTLAETKKRQNIVSLAKSLKSGAPGEIRTPDPQIRGLLLASRGELPRAHTPRSGANPLVGHQPSTPRPDPTADHGMIRTGPSSQQDDPTKDWISAAGRASLCALGGSIALLESQPRRLVRCRGASVVTARLPSQSRGIRHETHRYSAGAPVRGFAAG